MTNLTSSYVCSTAAAPLLFDTIGRALDAAVARHGPREALVVPFQDVRWTWAELGARSIGAGSASMASAVSVYVAAPNP